MRFVREQIQWEHNFSSKQRKQIIEKKNRISKLTTQLLVLAAKGILLLTSFVELMGDALDFGDLDAQVTLGLLVQLYGFLQARLNLNVDAFQLFSPLLELPSGSVGLLQVDDEYLNLNIRTCVMHQYFRETYSI